MDRYLQIKTPVFYLIFLFFILTYYPTFHSLYLVWVDPVNKGYSHGVLLSIILTFLLYREFSKNKELTIDLIYLPVIIFFSILWAVGRLGVLQSVEYFAMYAVLFLLFLQVINPDRLQRTYLVLAFLFSMPLMNVFNGTLQYLTAIFSYLLIKMSFIPIQRDGFLLLLPNGNFIVADYCSGLRQQIIALTLIIFYAYLNKLYFKQLSVLLLITVIVAFIINLIRIYIIILSGYFTNMTTSLVDDHSVLGWVIFGSGMFLYITLLNRFLFKLEKPG